MISFETMISKRQQKILTIIAVNDKVDASLLSSLGISRATFSRDMKELLNKNYVIRAGKGSSVTYTKGHNFYEAPLDIDDYFSIDQNKRKITEDYLFFEKMLRVFTIEETEKLEQLCNAWHTRYKASSDTLKKRELERITIELSWKSSQIEGNTYSLLDTERLIKESIEAKNHTHEEAVMILNHKKAFTYLYEHQTYFRKITKKNIEELHTMLVDGLKIGKGLRKGRVGIIGTNYIPKENNFQLEESMFELIVTINNASSPIDKAFIALLGISYLQLFEDGNKRLSRMFANAILIAHHLPPMSFRSIDEVEYKKALIIAYESKNINLLKSLFIEQLERSAIDYF